MIKELLKRHFGMTRRFYLTLDSFRGQERIMKKYFKNVGVVYFLFASMPALFGQVVPSDVISFFDEWKITLGNGSTVNNLVDYEHDDYFYATSEDVDWVVYKTPNSGGTTPNSSNTRSELRHLPEWTPETGGRLTGTLKVMHVSTTGDARVPASFSVVVGQIHSNEGHKNEPLKIYYKKFPGHTKGSVFWNYEINTQGNNDERWDFSTAVWGHDWSLIGPDSVTSPEEPSNGIELGEEFSYEINVFNGIMYLTFISDGHPTKTFTKSLVSSEYSTFSDLPLQVLNVFSSTGQDGIETPLAYSGELQYFKQGAYNQTNGKNPADNMVWNTGADTYGGDLGQQYANGSYAAVWFKEATVGVAIDPSTSVNNVVTGNVSIYPIPTVSFLQIHAQDFSITSLQLFNSSGQSMMKKSYRWENDIQLDLSKIEAGHYYLVIENELKQKVTREIIKQ